MAEYFVRPDSSHNTTRDGLTYGTAWGGWSEVKWGALGVKAEDILYVCGVHTLSNFIAVGTHGATSSARTVISGGYGPNPGRVVFNTGNFFLQIGKDYTTLEDLPIVANTSNCVFLFSANVLTGVTIQRCELTGGVGAPILNASGSNGQSHVDLTIEDNDFIGGSDAPLGGAINWVVAKLNSPLSNLNRVTINNNRFTGCSAARAVIELRLEDEVNDNSNMADIVITNNTFTDCSTLGMEIFGHPLGLGKKNTGLRITGNKFYDMTNTPAAFNIGGAMGIGGFSDSLTPGFGGNVLTRNEGFRLTGPSGLFNLFYGNYEVYDNYGEDIYASQADGNGLLFDFGCVDTVAYRNHFRRVIGNPATENSGCGIMVLNAANITAYGNVVEGCKIGVYVGNKSSGQSSNIYNNTFTTCSYAGVLTLSTADMGSNLVRNNIFTGTPSVPSVLVKSGVLTSESTNCFHGFGSPTGHTLSPSTITTDPQLDERYGCASNAVKGQGVFIDTKSDFYNRLFKNPPILGAVEVVSSDIYRTLRGI